MNGELKIMGKVLIFGHQNPDTDSITSSLVLIFRGKINTNLVK